MIGENDFQESAGRIEELVAQLDAVADPAVRAAAKELVEAVMELYRGGLERTLEIVSLSEGGDRIASRLGRDELVGGLLVLHGLHPDGIETRVKRALEKVRPYLRKHGAEAELLGVEEGAVRVRVQADGHGCGSTGASLKETVEAAIFEAAPDLLSLHIEGADEPLTGFVPLESLAFPQPGLGSLNESRAAAGGQNISGEIP